MLFRFRTLFEYGSRPVHPRYRFLLFLLALILITASGCVRESQSGTARTFKYQLWLPLSVLVGGIVAGPVGWFLRRQRYGWAMLVLGPLATLFFAPTLFLERVTLDDNTYTVRSGIWGMTASHQVDLSKLKYVAITTEENRGRRGRTTTSTYLICNNQDGSVQKLSVNNDVTRAGAPHFLAKIAARGVPVAN